MPENDIVILEVHTVLCNNGILCAVVYTMSGDYFAVEAMFDTVEQALKWALDSINYTKAQVR